jgi:3-isopropylmalate/(R)-2-methylmalate dehydratase small subunit
MQPFTTLSGVAAPFPLVNVDTDMIIPKQFLKTIVRTGLGSALFFELRTKPDGSENPDFVLYKPQYRDAKILVTGANFGCGSSREHAPQALNRFGIKVIVGESFASIFAGNCTMMGVPTVTVSEKEIQQLIKSVEENPKTEYSVDLDNKTLTYGKVKIAIDLPETYRTALTMGSWDSTALLRANLDQVKQTAKKLPYMNSFAG